MKKIYTLMLFCILSTNLFSQTFWNIHDVPVLLGGEPGTWEEVGVFSTSVIVLNDVYHMWYGGVVTNGIAIGHATSTDGLIWTKDAQNPVLDNGEAGTQDAFRAYLPEVVHDGTTFHMWYVGANNAGSEKLCYATSTDGVDWVKHDGKPAFELGGLPYDNSDGKPGHGSVIFDDGQFQMWYHTSKNMDNQPFFMRYAISTNGSDWIIDEGDPLLQSGATGEWDNPRLQISSVVIANNKYHMWYSGGKFMEWRLGYATSDDNINWTKYDTIPVMDLGASFIAFPSVIYDDTEKKYKMWYSVGGGADDIGYIGYAETPPVGTNNTIYEKDMSIFPNPASDIVKIRSEFRGVQKLEITSINGQLIFSGQIDGNESQIDISQWSKGVYLVKLKSAKYSCTRMLVKL